MTLLLSALNWNAHKNKSKFTDYRLLMHVCMHKQIVIDQATEHETI